MNGIILCVFFSDLLLLLIVSELDLYLVHLIEIHRVFCCLMYEYTMIYLSILCLVCFGVVSGSCNRQGCIEYPSLYVSPGYTCAVASLGCVLAGNATD